MDIPRFNTGEGGAHAHRVTIPQARTTIQRTGQIMPYVQMPICGKD